MVEKAILTKVREYLGRIAEEGIPVVSGVIFGSFARGEQQADSDIDLLVVSPAFDGTKDRNLIDTLWRMTWRVDSRIEPFGVGVREFEENDASPLIGIARREGIVVPFKPLRTSPKVKVA